MFIELNEPARRATPPAPRALPFPLRPLSLVCIGMCGGLSTLPVLANPAGAHVASGAATFTTSGGLLVVRNSPGAVINWQSFSIGAGQTTNFVQQSISSAVLNRVVGIDPSTILGTLKSNGRVFLINPNGVVFGSGAVVDAAGLVVSTLNLTDADFKAGRMQFSGGSGAGEVQISGIIRSENGDVYIVAPNIVNEGSVEATNGGVVLAAGESVDIYGRGLDNIKFEVQNKSNGVLNLGSIDGDAVGIFAGSIRQAGNVNANAIAMTGGHIILSALGDVTLAAGSQTRADAAGTGGTIAITSASGDIDGSAGSLVSASGQNGGTVTLTAAAGGTRVLGDIEASGTLALGSVGPAVGGTVEVLGKTVAIDGSASVDASGTTGGGTIFVGGGPHGTDAAVPDARTTEIGSGASVSANAATSGAGGTIVVYSTDTTHSLGTLDALGGASAGAGGSIETSSGNDLYLGAVLPDARSRAGGKSGVWLLDPGNITIDNNANPGVNELNASNLAGLLETESVTVSTAGVPTTGAADTQSIAVTAPINAINISGANTLTLQAGGSIAVSANITGASATGGTLGVNLYANFGAPAAPATGLGAITIANGVRIATAGGDFNATGTSFNNGGTIATSGASAGQNAGAINVTLTSTGTSGPANLTTGTMNADGASGAVGASLNGGAGGAITLATNDGAVTIGTLTSRGGTGVASGVAGGAGGNGGSGAAISVSGASIADTAATAVTSSGGPGGAGGAGTGNGAGGAGGAGGSGGPITLTSTTGDITLAGTYTSSGGAGGAGGDLTNYATNTALLAGNGGAGGSGDLITISAQGNLTTQGTFLLQSFGGDGGKGGDLAASLNDDLAGAGNGGDAGNSGYAALSATTGDVTMTGGTINLVGGAGGAGGVATILVGGGGNGGAGGGAGNGQADALQITADGAFTATNLVISAIGGNGGDGGANYDGLLTGAPTVGGNGGAGGNSYGIQITTARNTLNYTGGSITVTGGNGGNAGGAEGVRGKDAGSAGTGGDADGIVYGSNADLTTSATLTVTGGNGGTGGDSSSGVVTGGGNGGIAGDVELSADLDVTSAGSMNITSGSGGNGGNGGATGGNGGNTGTNYGLSVYSNQGSIQFTGGTIDLEAGNPGNGGTGATAGNQGNGFNVYTSYLNAFNTITQSNGSHFTTNSGAVIINATANASILLTSPANVINTLTAAVESGDINVVSSAGYFAVNSASAGSSISLTNNTANGTLGIFGAVNADTFNNGTGLSITLQADNLYLASNASLTTSTSHSFNPDYIEVMPYTSSVPIVLTGASYANGAGNAFPGSLVIASEFFNNSSTAELIIGSPQTPTMSLSSTGGSGGITVQGGTTLSLIAQNISQDGATALAVDTLDVLSSNAVLGAGNTGSSGYSITLTGAALSANGSLQVNTGAGEAIVVSSDVLDVGLTGYGQVALNGSTNTVATTISNDGNLTVTSSGRLTIGNSGQAAEISSTGDMTLDIGGDLNLIGGTNPGTTAQVVSVGAASITVGGDLLIQGGAGTNSFAQVLAPGMTTVSVNGAVTLQGGGGAGAFAVLDPVVGEGTGLTLAAGALNLRGGSNTNTYAALESTGDIRLTIAGAITLTPGTGGNADAAVVTTAGTTSYTAAECVDCGGLPGNPLTNTVTDGGFYPAATTTAPPPAPPPAPAPAPVAPPPPPEIDIATILANGNVDMQEDPELVQQIGSIEGLIEVEEADCGVGP